MPVTNSTDRPASVSTLPPSLNQLPTAQRQSPRSNWNESSINADSAVDSCFSYISQCFERLAQWIQGIMHRLFGADRMESEGVNVNRSTPQQQRERIHTVTINRVTPEQIEQRIQKGRGWIEDGLNEVIRNGQPNLHQDKFLVEISYKGKQAISFPASDPADLTQLKNDAIAKLGELIRSPRNMDEISSHSVELSVTVHFFRRTASKNGQAGSLIEHSERRNFYDFMSGNNSCLSSSSERVMSMFKRWLDNSLLHDSTADGQNIINYVSELMAP